MKEFIPGKGYRYLLGFAKDGVLDYSDVEKRISCYKNNIRDRETSIKKRMLNKLVAADYLEPMKTEDVMQDNYKTPHAIRLFRLTEKAVEFMGEKNNPEIEAEIKTKHLGKQTAIKITKFDLDNIVQPSKDGVFTKEMLDVSLKKAPVEKRIQTLAVAGLLIPCDKGWKLSNEILDRPEEPAGKGAEKGQVYGCQNC